jgi:proteic killer suppression protein
MIHSFGNRLTEDLYHGVSSAKVRRMPWDIKELALYKLDILEVSP